MHSANTRATQRRTVPTCRALTHFSARHTRVRVRKTTSATRARRTSEGCAGSPKGSESERAHGQPIHDQETLGNRHDHTHTPARPFPQASNDAIASRVRLFKGGRVDRKSTAPAVWPDDGPPHLALHKCGKRSRVGSVEAHPAENSSSVLISLKRSRAFPTSIHWARTP